MKLNEKNIELVFVLILLVLGFYYAFLASNTQMLGEDEATYFLYGKEFSQNNFKLFEKRGIYSLPINLPIFIPLVYALPFMIFGASLSLAKIITTIFGVLTVIVVYLIGKRINIWYGIISASLLFSISLFSHFMLIAYVDVSIAFFSALITYLILTLNDLKKSIFLGIILGMSYHTKATGLFLIFMPLIYSFIFYKEDKKIFKLSIISIFIATLLIAPIVIKNIIFYDYPFFEGLNYFFKNPYPVAVGIEGATKVLSPNILNLGFYINTIGWVILITFIFGCSWFIINKKNKQLNLFIIFIVFFIFLFNISYISALRVVENRYLFILFPQLSLVGGFFLWKLKEKNKYLLVLVIPLILFSFYTSIVTAQTTANSQRYSSDYIEALEWIKKNTPQGSFIFTPYRGSLNYFAERDIVWWKQIPEFTEIMRNPNGGTINEILKGNNISYILIWRGIIAEDVIIPQSNIVGAMTQKFVNEVVNDAEHFNITYQNQNNVILKVV